MMFDEDDVEDILFIIIFITCVCQSCTQGKLQKHQFSTQSNLNLNHKIYFERFKYV